MPLPRPKIALDPPDVIEAREREKPADETIVLAKIADGTVVMMLNNGELYKWPDGELQPYRPWNEPVDEAIVKKLKPGIVEQFTFKWVAKYDHWLPKQQGAPRWRPVKKSEHEVHCPYAYGDQTDGFIHNIDTILHKRDREFSEKVARQSAYSHDPQRFLAGRKAEMADRLSMASGIKVTNVEETFQPIENDAIEMIQDPNK